MNSLYSRLVTAHKIVVPLAGIVAIAIAGYINFIPYGIGWNTTASIPVGVYLTKTYSSTEPVDYGDIVCFQYPEPVWAKGRTYVHPGVRVCKPVVGQPGDTLIPGELSLEIIRKSSGTATRLPLLALDRLGRVLLPAVLTKNEVAANTVFVISDYKKNSLDSRYFGAIPLSSITHKIFPIIVSKETP